MIVLDIVVLLVLLFVLLVVVFALVGRQHQEDQQRIKQLEAENIRMAAEARRISFKREEWQNYDR